MGWCSPSRCSRCPTGFRVPCCNSVALRWQGCGGNATDTIGTHPVTAGCPTDYVSRDGWSATDGGSMRTTRMRLLAGGAVLAIAATACGGSSSGGGGGEKTRAKHRGGGHAHPHGRPPPPPRPPP